VSKLRLYLFRDRCHPLVGDSCWYDWRVESATFLAPGSTVGGGPLFRYFCSSILLSGIVYGVLRFSAGVVVFPDIDPALAKSSDYVIPGLVAVFFSAWVLRPLIRGQQFVAAIFGMFLYPFLAGMLFVIMDLVFNLNALQVDGLLETLQLLFIEMTRVPLWVGETAKLAFPLAAVVVYLLRRSDPPEMLKSKSKLASVDPYRRS